jgi:vancomycin resistance protein YoaR
MNGKKLKKFLVVIISLILAFMLFIGIAMAIEPERAIDGVSVLDIDLSGLNRQECEARLQSLNRQIKTVPITVRYLDREWEMQPADIGLDLDTHNLLKEIMSVGHQGSIIQRIKEYKQAKTTGYKIPLLVELDKDKLTTVLNSFARQITTTPVNAYLKINPDDTVEVVPSKDGMSVDINRAYQDIVAQYKKYDKKPAIEMVLTASKAEKTTEDILKLGVEVLISSYTTYFDSSDTGRAYNISVAAKALDGILVAPGEIFSFNQVVGPRSSESGYKNAKIIINNEFVDGIGGGVCQVSSTLYNAVLLANMGIVERSNHSLPVSYVPYGRDATVAYNLIDFCFKNTSPKSIYIKTITNAGRITIKIYGNTSAKKQVTISTKVVERIPYKVIEEFDPNLAKGLTVIKRHGIQGLKVSARRLVLENGSYKSEDLPSSRYNPLNQIVVKGTAEKPGQNQPPEIPGLPETPEVPEIPDVPETPEIPEEPEEPKVPEPPESPDNRGTPENDENIEFELPTADGQENAE